MLSRRTAARTSGTHRYAFVNPVAKWLLVIVAVLYLAAVVLSRRRPG